MAAGDYDDNLVNQQRRAEDIFNTPGEGLIYKPNVGTVAALIKETTAKINTAYNGTKKEVIEVFFDIPVLASGVQNAISSCTITGVEPENSSVEYQLARARQVDNGGGASGFSINERKFETSMSEANNMVAKNKLRHEKTLLEDLNTRSVAVLDTLANKTNLIDAGWDGISELVDSVTADVCIPPVDWTIDGIFPKVWEIANRLQMVSPFIIDYAALTALRYKMTKGLTGEDAKRANNMLEDFRYYTDMQGVAALGKKKFFLVDRGIFAYLNRPDWFNTVPEARPSDTWTWSEVLTAMNADMNGTGPIGPLLFSVDGDPVNLRMDWRMQRTCSTRREFMQKFEPTLNADLVKAPVNPATADGLGGNNYTGIVAFQCNASPTPAS